MKKMLFLVFVLSVSGFSAMDGHLWGIFDEMGKVAYVAGYVNGVGFAKTANDKYVNAARPQGEEIWSIKISTMIPAGFDTDAIVAALNKFYMETANLNISIHAAIYIIAQRVNGVSQEDVQKIILSARKASSETK